MAVVVVRESASVSDGEGGTVFLRRGDGWDDTHPIVKRHPSCFATFAPIERGGFESASATPGEKRGR
jgi:hypothetical protein